MCCGHFPTINGLKLPKEFFRSFQKPNRLKFQEALGSGIGTGSVFLPFIYNFKQYPQYASMQAIDIFQENPVKFQK